MAARKQPRPLKVITRDRHLTPEEGEKYRVIREQVKQDLPDLIKQHNERMARRWPEAADGRRLQNINNGMFAVLAAVKHFVYDGDANPMTYDWLRKYALKQVKPPATRLSVEDALALLLEDEVLVDKSGDGILKLDLSKLEERIEIYNETP